MTLKEDSTSSSLGMSKHETKKYILLTNLGSKHGLVMKFGKLMSYYIEKNYHKILLKMWARN